MSSSPTTAILLTSQPTDGTDGFETHGIFPSVRAAVLHISKDAELDDRTTRHLINAFEYLKNPLISTTLNGEQWRIIHTPIRSEAGV